MNPTDLEKLEAGELPIFDQTANLAAQAERAEVIDDETAGKATDLIKIIQSFRNTAEDERKSYVKPLNDTVKRINANFKKITEPLDEAKRKVSEKLTAYLSEKEAREREEARQRIADEQANAIDVAAQMEQSGRADEASALIDAASSAGDRALARTRSRSRGSSTGAGASTRHVWTFDVVSPGDVPRSFLTVDESALRQYIEEVRHAAEIDAVERRLKGQAKQVHINAYIEEYFRKEPIAGVKVYQKVSAVVR